MKKIVISCIVAFLLTILIVFMSYCYLSSQIESTYEIFDVLIAIISCLLSIWVIVPVIFLLIEKYNDSRPKVVITFELIRSCLICLVIKNIGNVETELVSLDIEDKFLSQLDDDYKVAFSKMKKTNILVAPQKYWILNFGVTTFNLLSNFENKVMNITYKYKKVGRKKAFTEKLSIDFESYSHFMVYISEMDELNNSINKLTKAVEKNNKNIAGKLVETTRLLSAWTERQKVE